MKHFIHISLLALAAFCGCAPAFASSAEPPGAVIEEAATVRPVASGVEIEVPGERDARVEIYAITGQLVRSVRVPAGHSHIELGAGCYIVRVDGRSTRVIIR